MTVVVGRLLAVAEHDEYRGDRFYFELGRLFQSLDDKLDEVLTNQGAEMAQIDALRQAQADEKQAIADLGDRITAEAQQIADVLAQLVAAQGNQVTDADVQAALDSVAALKAAGAAVSGLVPDAPAPDPNA